MRLRFLSRAGFAALIALLVALVPAASAQDAANLVDGCVESYDAETDYFPEKASIVDATTFEVEYFNNYKVIRVLTPWAGAEQAYEYVLVQCGTPAPEGYDDSIIIEVPIQSVIVMSTTYLPHLVELDVLASLVAVDEADFAYDAEVRDLIEAGDVIEVGGGSTVDVEQVLELDPDVVMTYGLGNPDFDAHPVLIEAGIPVALNADYVETSPLGRAEWLKFTAMFYNREGAANDLFNVVAADYEALSASVADIEDRPTVLVNGMFMDTWFVSGGGSFAAQLIEDAGGAYLWADDESQGGLPLSFEAVLDRAQDADIWLNANFWRSLDEGLAEDERYAEFAPFQNQSIFNNNARTTELGGNDYSESGVLRPDLVLADLIKIFHPDVLPNHELIYYQQLQ